MVSGETVRFGCCTPHGRLLIAALGLVPEPYCCGAGIVGKCSLEDRLV
jgi:hypothetical protein